MAWGHRSYPASAHPCLLSSSLQRGPDLPRVSGNPVNSHTKTLFPALECPYFSRSPQPPARPGSGAVLSPSGQPSWGGGAQESRSGEQRQPQVHWTVTAQVPSGIAGTKPGPQCPDLWRTLSPEPPTRGLAELARPLRRRKEKPRRWRGALLSQISLCGRAELMARPLAHAGLVPQSPLSQKSSKKLGCTCHVLGLGVTRVTR